MRTLVTERKTALITAAKIILQMFIIQCFSGRQSRRKLFNYSTNPIEDSIPNHSVRTMVQDKPIVMNEIREQLHVFFTKF